MKLLSVNVSLPKTVEHKTRRVETGIFKTPLTGRVMLRTLNLDGDGQADLEAHGGAYKAVYAYPIENYRYWEQTLNRDDFTPGQFGENFTVEGMTEDQIHVGDVFRVGGALVQVTQPRVPCFKLNIRMNDLQFSKHFLQSLRTGFYLRVLEEGEVGAGDTLELVEADPIGLSVRDVMHLYYFDAENLHGARRALDVEALSPGWKGGFAERIMDAAGLSE